MQGYVYILECANLRYYIGSTTNLQRRLSEHLAGKTASTRYVLPVKLVFSQVFTTIPEARKVEYRLKKFKSKRIILRIIKDQRTDVA